MVKNQHAWVTLAGGGPVYRDPKLILNSNIQYPQRGTITVDLAQRRVSIDLVEVTSKPGEPEVTKQNPLNGAYEIRHITNEEFIRE